MIKNEKNKYRVIFRTTVFGRGAAGFLVVVGNRLLGIASGRLNPVLLGFGG